MRLQDEIALKFQHLKPTFHLADQMAVGLPIYSVTIRGLTLSRKPIPPIEEFVLKCIDRGLRSTTEISEFLGLEEAVITNTLVNLAQMDCIALIPEPASRRQILRVTRKGKTTLQTVELEEPEEREFRLHFDGLLRKATWYERFETLRYDELREKDLFEIQAYPPKKPQLSDLEVRDVERIVRALGNPDRRRRDLLAIKKIERVQKLYLPAVALAYVSDGVADIQVAFLIDKKLSVEHELAYAKMDGPKKQGIEKTIRASVLEGRGAEELKGEFEMREKEVNQAEDEVTRALLAAEQCETRLESADDDAAKETLKLELERLEKVKRDAEAALQALPIRNLYTYDHPPLLEEALNQTKERLMIISPWIMANVVDKMFLEKLEVLLKKHIAVFIGYGIKKQPTGRLDPEDQAARDELSLLAGKYSNFHFKRLGDTHAKILIKDSDFSVISSFNWLSFKGDPNRTFRDEQGLKVQDRNFIEQKFAELLPRFS
jgi:DNA-binding MarR family transcriptional regulator